MAIYLLNKFEPNPYVNAIEVDTTSRGSFKDLSPFFLGPIKINTPQLSIRCNNMENLWQYSKVYKEYADPITKHPTPAFFEWQAEGFNKTRAVRYPMGKGVKPLYSFWFGHQYDYVDARKNIYIPYYANLVLQTKSYALLYNWVIQGYDIVLRDFDGYNYDESGISLKEVVNSPRKSLGHAFVIKMLLTGGYKQYF